MTKQIFLQTYTNNYQIKIQKKPIKKLVVISSMFAPLGIELAEKENHLYLKIRNYCATYFIGNKKEISNLYTLNPLSKKIKIIVPETYETYLEKKEDQDFIATENFVK